MKRTGRKKEWAILGFCVFLLGVFPPILYVFDKPNLVLGLPLSFLYLYGFWALMIVFIAIGARRRRTSSIEDGMNSKIRRPEGDAGKSETDYV